MEALSKLGIDWRLLIAQIVNFAILLFLLHKFLYQPLLAMLEKRRAMIENTVMQAKEISEKLAAGEKEKSEELSRARKEAAQIIEKATLQAQERSDVLLGKTKQELAQIVDQTRASLKREKQKMLDDAQKEFSGLVLTASRKVLSDVSDARLSEKLTNSAVIKFT